MDSYLEINEILAKLHRMELSEDNSEELSPNKLHFLDHDNDDDSQTEYVPFNKKADLLERAAGLLKDKPLHPIKNKSRHSTGLN